MGIRFEVFLGWPQLALNTFKLFELEHIRMGDVLKLISYFPLHVKDGENSDLYRGISKEELRAVISSFKKDKIPRPDGWTTKFFEDFFDVVGDDLLQAVEEVRLTGKMLGCIIPLLLPSFQRQTVLQHLMIFVPELSVTVCIKLWLKLLPCVSFLSYLTLYPQCSLGSLKAGLFTKQSTWCRKIFILLKPKSVMFQLLKLTYPRLMIASHGFISNCCFCILGLSFHW